MGDFFSYEWIPILLNMSLTASAVILCVLLVRLLLCRAPRVFSYALWAVVLFRLLPGPGGGRPRHCGGVCTAGCGPRSGAAGGSARTGWGE